jgi:hypothetical protein
MYLLFVWRGTNDFDAGKLILSAMEGVGPENQEFLGPEKSVKWHRAKQVPFQGLHSS